MYSVHILYGVGEKVNRFSWESAAGHTWCVSFRERADVGIGPYRRGSV